MAHPKNEILGDDPTSGARVARVDMKFEVVVIPVSDVDRAKEFYARLGWRLDGDFAAGDDWRAVQFTPPGSGCSLRLPRRAQTSKQCAREPSASERFGPSIRARYVRSRSRNSPQTAYRNPIHNYCQYLDSGIAVEAGGQTLRGRQPTRAVSSR